MDFVSSMFYLMCVNMSLHMINKVAHKFPYAFITWLPKLIDTPSSSLMDSTTSPKLKTMEGERVGARSLARSTLGVEGRVGASGWD
jgi:hypothetical protein